MGGRQIFFSILHIVFIKYLKMLIQSRFNLRSTVTIGPISCIAGYFGSGHESGQG